MFKQALLRFAIISLFADVVFFSAAYFYNAFLPSYYLYIYIFLLIAIFSFIRLEIHLFKKILIMAGFFILGFIVFTLIMVLTMFTPGSKEHNYVMYHICLPKLNEYYKTKGKSFSLDEKGWKEHTLCEQNVWNNKEPMAGIK